MNFLDRFSNNPKIPSVAKILTVGAELLHADGQTDMTKLIVAFRNFAKASKNDHHAVFHTQFFIVNRAVSLVFHLTYSPLSSVPLSPNVCCFFVRDRNSVNNTKPHSNFLNNV